MFTAAENVAQALVPAVSALLPTPGPGVHTSVDTARRSACATNRGVETR